ncbi:MAG: zf-TFIIB domain-containing protein [bacterium]
MRNSSREVGVWEPGKPSQNENEYFARRDAEWLKEQRARLDAERLSKDKALPTGMTCPRCNGDLTERIYHSVRIDVCDTCRGVWLDRGELHMLAHVEATAMLHVIHDIDTGTR